MDQIVGLLGNMELGLISALTPINVFYCFFGVCIGMLVGVIPGMGAMAAMSLLFPITFHLEPTAALIMLAGIYYGTAYGGSTASILLNLPGTPSSAVTCLDGYPMAVQGRAGVALLLTTTSSFIAASVGIMIMTLFSPVIVQVALQFGPTEYFSLMVLGSIAAASISSGSVVKSVAMVVLGSMFGVVGLDVYSGEPRFGFGLLALYDGFSLVVVAMGLFGIAEVVSSVGRTATGKVHDVSLASLVPTRDDVRRSWWPTFRGTAIGSFFGILPGTGPTLAAYASYAVEKRVADDPSRFGKGAVEGVCAPEAANNAADQTAFIPTLVLGIPGSPTMALIMGVLIIHGIAPGPTFMANHPDMFWGLIVSFWIGNLLLLMLNIPLIGIWVRMLQLPYHYIYPAIIVFVCIGAFSIHNSLDDVWLVLVFGALGYLMRVFRFDAAPFILGFVLGPMMEENFRRAMLISRGNLMTFIERPISGTVLALTVIILCAGIYFSARGAQRTRAASGA